MDDDILIDVFRLLSRKQLSQSVALVCRRFRHLVISPALPNLHYMKYNTRMNDNPVTYPIALYPVQEWGFVINTFVEKGPDTSCVITYEQLQTTHRPAHYLRFAYLQFRPEHLAKEHWRKCLWEFRHCFVDSFLMLEMCAQLTALEFQCFLADWVLRLFPNCTYSITDGIFISSTDNVIVTNRFDGNFPTLEERANFNKSKFLHFRASDRQAVASCLEPSLLISLPSIFNCPCVEITARKLRRRDRCCDPFIPQEDVIEWLHHVPAVPSSSPNLWKIIRVFGNIESKRCLVLSSAMLEPREEDIRDNWSEQLAQVSRSVIKQVKKRFLLAKTSEEKREFFLALDAFDIFDQHYGVQRLEPIELAEGYESRTLELFDIQNNATNERLTLGMKISRGDYSPGGYIYTLWRKSA
ncbi:hypothetical protein DdX_20251 [Ditylenchus destructor]|uniref:F-box domain-containing protein n=1 Tax=Ditylenchus destructor TaxID=166010 RepID=A0AAD4QWD0_9BILA|nr:hypothetical protein DdX_20251 [Ditylenchus destructor]